MASHDERLAAVKCLNEALNHHGYPDLMSPDEDSPMTEYVNPNDLIEILEDARRRAEEQGVAGRQEVDVTWVYNLGDALGFVMGHRIE